MCYQVSSIPSTALALAVDDFSVISEQTTLASLHDYSVSNIYVGYLKAAYKEVIGVLDKIAVLLNHYLSLGLREDSCYYRSVWYVHGEDGRPQGSGCSRLCDAGDHSRD
jgi:HEPN superfamily protein